MVCDVIGLLLVVVVIVIVVLIVVYTLLWVNGLLYCV